MHPMRSNTSPMGATGANASQTDKSGFLTSRLPPSERALLFESASALEKGGQRCKYFQVAGGIPRMQRGVAARGV
jgi:hypothetical protein